MTMSGRAFSRAEDAIRKEYQKVQVGYITLEELLKNGDAPDVSEE